jgi:gliding motility-associated-like protein
MPVVSASNNGPKCEGDALTLTAANGSAFSWSGPAGFSSSTQSPVITNTSLNVAGKYYVSVTSDKGCINTDSTIVAVTKRPVVYAGSDTIICEGTSVVIQGTAANATSYSWSPSKGLSSDKIVSPVASPTDTTMYILTITNGVCSNADSVTINVMKKPVANAGLDKRTMQGQSVQLNGSATGNNISYNWTPVYNVNSPTTLQPMVSPLSDTTYTLHVVSNDGCGSASDKVFVRVYKKVIVPNAFSPNGDGINDKWYIQALETYPAAEVSVFNRYGQMVFFNRGYTRLWDGLHNSKPLPAGAYYYLVDLKEDMPMLSGWVVILR